jgi:NAD(P)-dependent dehydrogenase (short-subunit alcohol dehydrogenase family)
MTDVQGRTAFITGGANGIGLGIARNLARAGAKLALADLDAAALARAKTELKDLTEVETYQLDVRDRETFAATADAVESALGPVSLLFNNAGVAGGAPAAKATYEIWDWLMGINLGGVINGVQTFLPRMVAHGKGGHIVNTASGAGLVQAGAGVLYTTSKFGVVGLSESLNAELGAVGIGVSVLCPGPVATDIVQRTAASAPKLSTLTEAEQQRGAEGLKQSIEFLKQGVSIDDVGAMVLKAIRDGSLYIHTDRMVEPMIQMRSKALLDAMPD